MWLINILIGQVTSPNEEEIMKIYLISLYLIYDGFDNYLDAAMVYERVLDSTEVLDMYSCELTFL